ncbi:hypothetical protein WJX74_006480 [Apatococcus lobatus]|uniref:Delta(14)-sterol reductase n=1 Tax=Apatococcus lobatus TaxID=904363 RepID=A0AAW1QD54_9CHLO
MFARTPQTAHHFEFWGPYLGPVAIICGLPLVTFFLQWYVAIFTTDGVHTNFTWVGGAVVVCCWLAGITALHRYAPGQRGVGVKLSTGYAIPYKLNGFHCFCLVMIACIFLSFGPQPLINLGWVANNIIPALAAMTIISIGLSIWLYASSFQGKQKLLAVGGSSGYTIYDFFIGRELNPRPFGRLFDLKHFCELYPGMIGWAILDLAIMHRQWTSEGIISLPMALTCLFQIWYVADALWFEPAILTTMDITTEGFGFMLAFGDLVWVPFTYCLQPLYILHHPQELSIGGAAGIVALKLVGYALFRGSNSQKNQFRQDPKHPLVAGLQTLPTKRGTRLIISGWWGLVRHPNYLGDWLMAWAWCLPCGFNSIIPYFYVIYFGILLVHRDGRDEQACQQKYGADWGKYCSIIKWRLVPFVY